MKYSIITLILICMNSCKSQESIDLLTIKLPVNKEVIINEDYEVTKENHDFHDYDVYVSRDPNLMNLSGKNVSDKLNDNKDYDTRLVLYNSQNTSKITSLYLTNYTTKKTKLIREILIEKFGEPNYYESTEYDTKSIWEDKSLGTLYCFRYDYASKYDNMKTEGSDLYIYDVDDLEGMENIGHSLMSYYITYLKARERKQDPNYTYRNFAEDEAKEGFGHDHYLEAINDLYEH